MNLDVLRLRRPKIDYVSPPVCEGTFSGSGSVTIVLDPFTRNRITGVVIEDDGNGNLIVSWPDFPGAVCYNVYEQLPDGTLLLIGECVEFCSFPLPPDDEPPVIVVTPIDEDGEGDPSDPARPPDGPPGPPVECDVFCDETSVGPPGISLFGTAKNIGLVAGTNPDTARPWVYRNRVSSDLRTSRDSGTIQASQGTDIVNATGDFFLPGDAGKFLQFDSGGNAREIITYISPSQVQVDISDTVPLSEFTIYGTTLGGPQGNLVCAGNGNHVAGVEARADLSGQDTFWCDRNTGEIRVLGDFVQYGAQYLNTAGFLLYTFNNGSTIESFVYNPNTSTSTQVGTRVVASMINDSNVVTGYELQDAVPFTLQRPIRWAAGVTTYLEPPDSMPLAPAPLEGPATGQGFLINSSGMIAGYYNQNHIGDNEHFKVRTFVNNGGASFSIGHFHTGDPNDPTTGEMSPEDLSDTGILVGTGEYADEAFCAWKWSLAEGLVQLGFLSGRPHSAANSVNDAGHIVGLCHGGGPPNGTAVIWLAGELTPQPLINFVDPEDAEEWDELIHAHAITNDNEVVGIGMKDGQGHFFFLKLCLDE